MAEAEDSNTLGARQQELAINHEGMAARLLAGPGTGKTWALTKRVVHLVQNDVLPTEILVLAFTRAAVQEVRKRLRDELGPDALLPRVSTLHSFALRQLLRNADAFPSLPSPLRIADDWEERHIIQEDLRDLINAVREPKLDVRGVRSLLRKLSADWETLRADEDAWEAEYPDPEFLAAWRMHRTVYGYTLRSELVYQLKLALYLHGGFDLDGIPAHLIIDEYHRLNPCDLKVAEWLRDHGSELFAAGDDDQSIYGFRNAYPLGIRNFLEEIKPSEDLRLEVCRRCDTQILRLADFIIRLDRGRVDKRLRSEDGREPGEVKLVRYNDQYAEAAAIAAKCASLIREGLPPSEILILLRQDRFGKSSAELARALQTQGVPVNRDSAEDGPFEMKGGRQLLALMRLSGVDEHDSLAWRTLIQLDDNSLGTIAIESVSNRAGARRTRFSVILEEIAANDATENPDPRIRDYVRATNAMIATIREHLDTDDIDADSKHAEFLTKLKNLPRPANIPDENDFQAALGALCLLATEQESWNLEGLMSELSQARREDEPVIDQTAVNILTMHKAKGLGMDVVFIAAAEEEFMPGRAEGPAIDDERRLFYVSITRAKHRLYITYCGRRVGDQLYSGSNPGARNRHLTSFLIDGPLRPENVL